MAIKLFITQKSAPQRAVNITSPVSNNFGYDAVDEDEAVGALTVGAGSFHDPTDGCIDGSSVGTDEGRRLGDEGGSVLSIILGWSLGPVDGRVLGPDDASMVG